MGSCIIVSNVFLSSRQFSFHLPLKKQLLYIYISCIINSEPTIFNYNRGFQPCSTAPPPPNNSNPPELLQTPIINSNQRFQPHLNSKPPLIFRTQEYKYCFHATNKLANEILQKLIYD